MKLHLVHEYHYICGGGPHAHNSCHPRHESTTAFPTSGKALAFAAEISEDDVRGEYETIDAPGPMFTLDELSLIVSAADSLGRMVPPDGSMAQRLRDLRVKAASYAFEMVS